MESCAGNSVCFSWWRSVSWRAARTAASRMTAAPPAAGSRARPAPVVAAERVAAEQLPAPAVAAVERRRRRGTRWRRRQWRTRWRRRNWRRERRARRHRWSAGVCQARRQRDTAQSAATHGRSRPDADGRHHRWGHLLPDRFRVSRRDAHHQHDLRQQHDQRGPGGHRPSDSAGTMRSTELQGPGGSTYSEAGPTRRTERRRTRTPRRADCRARFP